MKKKVIVAAVALVSQLTYSGTMGTSTPTTTTPFLGLEGSYTWLESSNARVNNSLSTDSRIGWGGRLSAGVIRTYTERTSLTAEFGGGYYGKADFNNTVSGLNGKYLYTGYDFLFGGIYKMSGIYKIDQLNLFLNVGAMLQNVDLRVSRDRTKLFGNGGTANSQINGFTRNSYIESAMLPEIKVGGFFTLYNNLDMTLSYLHVFGYKQDTTANVSASGNVIRLNGNVTHVNPSFNTIMLGARYNFA